MRELNDNDLIWLVHRWQEADASGTCAGWRVISLMLHGAWMAVYRHSADDADVYNILGEVADERRDEALEAELKREAA